MKKILRVKKLLISISAAVFLCQNLNIPYSSHTEAADISGTSIYVAETGNDFSGDGSSGNPYRSIKKGG